MSEVAEPIKGVRVDEKRLKIAMTAAGIKTDRELAKRSGVDERTIRNAKRLGSISWDAWVKMATAIGCNPIDLIVTPGFPLPKSETLAALLI